jgi:hypothetical protein
LGADGMQTILSEATLIIAITILAYFYAYSFETGFSFYFSYPPQIIGPTLNSFLGIWIILLFMIVSLYLQLNLQYWPHTKKWKAGFVLVSLVFVVIVLTMMAFIPGYVVRLAVMISSIIAIIAHFIYSINRKKDEASAERPKESEFSDTFTSYDKESKVPSHTIAYAILNKLRFDPVVYFSLFLVLFPGIIGYAGYTQAMSKSHFYLYLSDEGNATKEITIRMVGDTIITAPFNENENTYRREFRVRSRSDLRHGMLVPLWVNDLAAAE